MYQFESMLEGVQECIVALHLTILTATWNFNLCHTGATVIVATWKLPQLLSRVIDRNDNTISNEFLTLKLEVFSSPSYKLH